MEERDLGGCCVARQGGDRVEPFDLQRRHPLAQHRLDRGFPAVVDAQLLPQVAQPCQPVMLEPGLDLSLALHPFLQLAQRGEPGIELRGAGLGLAQRLLSRRTLVAGRVPSVVGLRQRLGGAVFRGFGSQQPLGHRVQRFLRRGLDLRGLGLQPFAPPPRLPQALVGGVPAGGRQLDRLPRGHRRCTRRFQRLARVAQRYLEFGQPLAQLPNLLGQRFGARLGIGPLGLGCLGLRQRRLVLLGRAGDLRLQRGHPFAMLSL